MFHIALTFVFILFPVIVLAEDVHPLPRFEIQRLGSNSTPTHRPYRIQSISSHLSPHIGIDKENEDIKSDDDFFKTLPGLSQRDREQYDNPFSVSEPLSYSRDELQQLMEQRKTWILREHCNHRTLVWNYTDEAIEDTQSETELVFDNGQVTIIRYPSSWEISTFKEEKTIVYGPFKMIIAGKDTADNTPYSFGLNTFVYPHQKIPSDLPRILKGVFQVRQVEETGELILYGVGHSPGQSENGCARGADGRAQGTSQILVPKNEVPIS